MKRLSIPFVLLLMATIVHLETIVDRTIRQCELYTKEFERTEKKYIDTHIPTPEEPRPDSPPNKELQKKVYEKEKRQRLFECITDRINAYLLASIETNPRYQALVQECKSKQSQPLCDPSYPYRTYDGTCNNLKNPKYGSVLNCLRRFTEQNYRGAAGVRQSVCGKPLPEPRLLSVAIHTDVDRPEQEVTHMNTFFGQFVAHDVTDVPITSIDGEPIACCLNKTCGLHPQCIPIYVKKNDPYYHKFNITCFNFKRAAMCDTCSVGKRSQMSQQTAYIDLSLVYGQTELAVNKLRKKDGTGKLKYQEIKRSGELLPREEGEEVNFQSGDRRVNQHTSLTSLHTLFHKEHNRIVEELKRINPHWGEERLFQEARKINIAQYQHIVYEEHLPVIIGSNLMTRYDLCVKRRGRTIYDPLLDATMHIEFNTAAYRLHSTINNVATDYKVDEGILFFTNTSKNPRPLYYDKMSSLMEGVCLSPAQNYDRFVAVTVSNYMYKEVQGKFGFDIASFNIQRGRDNGLPTYTEMVRYVSKGANNIQSFDDLRQFMLKENIDVLRKSYCDVKDIDLWIGMNNERVRENTVVAPTAANVIANQFKNLKFGDRFYFEHPGNFNKKQLTSLRSTSLSGVLCSNTKIRTMQLHALRFPSQTNPVVWCEDIPKVDLSLWKDKRV